MLFSKSSTVAKCMEYAENLFYSLKFHLMNFTFIKKKVLVIL